VINDLSNTPEYYLGGEVGSHESVIQIDVWTNGDGGRARANELGELVRNRLSGYRGALGSGVFCNMCEMIRNNTVAADPADGSNVHRRRNSMDFRIRHTADVPTYS
jgi:hypothetical protein